MPPRTAELAVGRDLEPDVFLLFDDFFDLAIFALAKLCGADRAFFPLRARLLQRRGSQQTADNIGAKRRLVSHHRGDPPHRLGPDWRADWRAGWPRKKPGRGFAVKLTEVGAQLRGCILF